MEQNRYCVICGDQIKGDSSTVGNVCSGYCSNVEKSRYLLSLKMFE